MKQILRICNIIITFFTSILVLLAAAIALPPVFGFLPCIILSGSMSPVLEAGSVAYIDTNDTECGIGDIITYHLTIGTADDTLVTHRIIRAQDNAFVTKGDANDTEDMNLVQKEQIAGILRFHIPGLGFLLSRITPKVKHMIIIWTILLNASSIALAHCFGNSARKP